MKIAVENIYKDIEAEANGYTSLAPHFTLYELANNKGDTSKPIYLISVKSAAHLNALEAFRNIINTPVIVNSGYRQKDYNEKIGGDKNSGHLIGVATDIQPPKGFEAFQIVDAWRGALASAGIDSGAINIYNSYYHLESFTRYLYGTPKAFTIRVYTGQVDYEYFKDVYKYADYDVKLVRK